MTNDLLKFVNLEDIAVNMMFTLCLGEQTHSDHDCRSIKKKSSNLICSNLAMNFL